MPSKNVLDLFIKKADEKHKLTQKIQKHKKYMDKSKEADKKRKPQKIKLKGIQKFEEYVTKCSICNRKIKKVVSTNIGEMGYRCYLTQIGFPTTKQRLSIKDFPDHVFEDLATEVIKEIENTDIKKLAMRMIEYDLRSDVDLKYPIIYLSYLHFRYFQKEKDWRFCSYIGNLYVLNHFISYPSIVFEKISRSKTFNAWFQKQISFYKFTRGGVSYKEFKPIYKGYSEYYDSLVKNQANKNIQKA